MGDVAGEMEDMTPLCKVVVRHDEDEDIQRSEDEYSRGLGDVNSGVLAAIANSPSSEDDDDDMDISEYDDDDMGSSEDDDDLYNENSCPKCGSDDYSYNCGLCGENHFYCKNFSMHDKGDNTIGWPGDSD